MILFDVAFVTTGGKVDSAFERPDRIRESAWSGTDRHAVTSVTVASGYWSVNSCESVSVSSRFARCRTASAAPPGASAAVTGAPNRRTPKW